MIRTIHKIISFPDRISGRVYAITRLFSKAFRRFLLIIFTVFRFLSPRFVSPRSKLPILFVPVCAPRGTSQLFPCARVLYIYSFIYLLINLIIFHRLAEFYPIPSVQSSNCRRKLFTAKIVAYGNRIVALCKWNTCETRIGEKKRKKKWNRETVQWNNRIACRSSARAFETKSTIIEIHSFLPSIDSKSCLKA